MKGTIQGGEEWASRKDEGVVLYVFGDGEAQKHREEGRFASEPSQLAQQNRCS